MHDPAVSARLRELYIERGMLLRVHLDVLYACDLDCAHCYLDDKKRPQASTAELIDVLRQARELGAMDLTLSGGEVFLRKDLGELLGAARGMGYWIRIKTHGGRIGADDAELLVRHGVGQVDVSVYALDPEVHDAFTRVPGSLARTLAGIDHLTARGIRVDVKTHVTQMNRHHYQAVYDHFTSRGMTVTVNAQIRGTNTLTTNTYPLNVAADEKVEVELFKIGIDGVLRDRPEPLAPEEARLCMAGVTSLYVAPDLTVTPCSAYPVAVGHLDREPLRAIWETAPLFATLRQARRQDIAICQTCPARKYCSYCVGAAVIETGDWRTPPEIICRSAFAAMEAAERFASGERWVPPPAAPSGRKKLGDFTILAGHLPHPGHEPHACA